MAKFRFPSINILRSFEAAARHQSVKKASRELHVTPGAVSHQIEKLETATGRQLFRRTQKSISLTECGESLYIAVNRGLAEIQRALILLMGNQAPERLVISVDPDFAGLWLVPKLAEFYSIVPNTLVEILAEKTLPALHDPRISCAIYYAEVGQEVEGREMLFRSRLFPVCAKSSALSAPLESLADLRHQVLLHDRSLTEWEQYLHGCGRPVEINVKKGIMFSHTFLCLEAASRGQGVAIGDDFLAANHLSEGRLVKPFGPAVLSKNAYYFSVFENASKHPAVNVFRMWLLQSIQRQREELGIP
jgi:LysR family glycine cleavage system transcriptional activator